jgi:hypothetical protein
MLIQLTLIECLTGMTDFAEIIAVRKRMFEESWRQG